MRDSGQTDNLSPWPQFAQLFNKEFGVPL